MPEEPVQETVTPTPEGGVVQPENVETPPVVEAPVETPPPPVETPPEGKKYRLKVEGKEIEIEDENEIINLAQKGLHYDKRMQALAAVEKQAAENAQIAQTIRSNPQIQKTLTLTAAGFPLQYIQNDPVPPNEAYRDSNPEIYQAQVAQYQTHQQIKTAADNLWDAFLAQSVQSNNTAVFEKARLDHNLSDEEFRETQRFVTERMRADQSGMYSQQDVDYAVMALLGKKKQGEALLKQTETIQRTIKEAKPHGAVPVRAVENLTPEEKEARAYKEYLASQQQGGWPKGK